MRENQYQAKLIKQLKSLFPGCFVLKNDPNYIQGMPDLTVLYFDRWATLEVKVSEKAHHQPNQDYYVETMDRMGFSAFIYPENEEQILDALFEYFNE